MIFDPFHPSGTHGLNSRLFHVGFTPRMNWVTAIYIHAAVPDSQLTFARPNLSDSGPNMLEA